MYKLETCHRAFVNPSKRKKCVRVAWETKVPDNTEYDEYNLEDQSWFKATSSLVPRLPSVVLVERVIGMEKTEPKGQRSVGKGKGDADSQKKPTKAKKTSDGILRRLELSTEGFWEFLHSDRWEDTCLLRVLKGELLNNLLFALHLMQRDYDVISYVTIAYLNDSFEVVPNMKNATIGETLDTPIREVLVELDHFCPMQKPSKKELEQLLQAEDAKIPAEDYSTQVKSEEKSAQPEDIPTQESAQQKASEVSLLQEKSEDKPDKKEPQYKLAQGKPSKSKLAQEKPLEDELPQAITSKDSLVQGYSKYKLATQKSKHKLPQGKSEAKLAQRTPSEYKLAQEKSEHKLSQGKSECKFSQEKSEYKLAQEKSEYKLGQEKSEYKLGQEKSEYKLGQEKSEYKLGQEKSDYKLGQEKSEYKLGQEKSEYKLGQEKSEYKLGQEKSEYKLGQEKSEYKLAQEKSDYKLAHEKSQYKLAQEKSQYKLSQGKSELTGAQQMASGERQTQVYAGGDGKIIKRGSSMPKEHRIPASNRAVSLDSKLRPQSRELSRRTTTLSEQVHSTPSAVDYEPPIGCHIRGVKQPPPHTSCDGPFHKIREPFYMRRKRKGRAFPPLTLPTPEEEEERTTPPPRSKGGTESIFALFEDELAFGPKNEEGDDLVSGDTHLQLSDFHPLPPPPSSKKGRSTGKPASLPPNVGSFRRATLKLPTPKLPTSKKTKKKLGDRSSPDSDDSGGEDMKKYCDRFQARAAKNAEDLAVMDNELVCRRLSRRDSCKFPSAEVPSSTSSARTGSPTKRFVGQGMRPAPGGQTGAIGRNAPLLPRLRQTDQAPARPESCAREFNPEALGMKWWYKCPTFIEYLRYLKTVGVPVKTGKETAAKSKKPTAKTGSKERDKKKRDRSKDSDGRKERAKKEPKDRDGGKSKKPMDEGKLRTVIGLWAFKAKGKGKKRGGKDGVAPEVKNWLDWPTAEDKELFRKAGLTFLEDPWHISVRFAYLAGGECDSVGVRNTLLNRRVRILQMIQSGISELLSSKPIDLNMCLKCCQKIRTEGVSGEVEESATDSKADETKLDKKDGNEERDKKEKTDKTDKTGKQDKTDKTGKQDKTDKQDKTGKQDKTDKQDKTNKKAKKIGFTDLPVAKRGDGKERSDKDTGKDKKKDGKKGGKQRLKDPKKREAQEEAELFASMGFEKIFDVTNLKSSYSFEKMFAHQPKKIDDYDKKLRFYSKPFIGRRKREAAVSQSSGTASALETAKTTVTESLPSPAPAPPTVLGKLRDFKFLKYRGYTRVPADSFMFTQPRNMTVDEIRDRLVEAMKIFVVRIERATTTRHYDNKISVTFTRRQRTDGSGPCVADTERVVSGACHTLSETASTRDATTCPPRDTCPLTIQSDFCDSCGKGLLPC